MIQNDLYTSYDTLELDNNVFDDDPFCNGYDDASMFFDNELYKSVNLNFYYHPSPSKSVSESSYHKPRSSKVQSFNNFPGKPDLPDTGMFCDFPESCTIK